MGIHFIVLGATVSGSGPYTYQWQFNGTNLPNNLIQTVAGKRNRGLRGRFRLGDRHEPEFSAGCLCGWWRKHFTSVTI